MKTYNIIKYIIESLDKDDDKRKDIINMYKKKYGINILSFDGMGLDKLFQNNDNNKNLLNALNSEDNSSLDSNTLNNIAKKNIFNDNIKGVCISVKDANSGNEALKELAKK